MNQDIEQSLSKIIKRINELKQRTINEAQTKEWLIKPFFSTLGWDFSNPDEVIPEDDDSAGKRTDYSLKINGKTKLLIEAKPLNNPLDDNKMIMEKLNYCSNSGTQLLIITNGDLYKIYYSDLKGIGKDKLLREFCLTDNLDEEIIEMLSRNAFEKDILLNYSKNISLLTNIKNVIEKLFSESKKPIINLINEGLKDKIGYKFHDDEIKKALKNISLEISLDNTELIVNNKVFLKTDKEEDLKKHSKATLPSSEIDYTIDEHFKNGEWKISVQLYNKFIEFLKINKLKFSVKPMKHYINLCFNDKSFCQINGLKSSLKLFINLQMSDLTEHEVLKVRDVTHIGHLGIGNIELKILKKEDFDLAYSLIKKSYNKLK